MGNDFLTVAGTGIVFIPFLALSVAAEYFTDLVLDETLPALTPPRPNQPPFAPPFTGGQCRGNASEGYWVIITRYFNPNTDEEYINPNPVPFGSGYQAPAAVAVDDISIVDTGFFQSVRIVYSNGRVETNSFQFGNSSGDIPISNFSVILVLYDYALNRSVPDNCGDLPNPNPIVPIDRDGGDLYFIGDDDDPDDKYDPNGLITAAAILAGLAAIAAAIKGVADSLSGIQKIGEALEKIAELLKKLTDRNDEEDKKDPDKRGVSFGEWFELPIDGGFGLKPITKGEKEYTPSQVQFLFEKFPSTCSRRVGDKSPSWANYEPIGWAMPRSVTRGYYEPIAIRYLNNIVPLPRDCDGFSFSFRENPSIEGKVRIIYSYEPELID